MNLRTNPLTMRGVLDRCWLFTYQTSIASARAILPPPLEPVTHGESAFWNVVVCHIRSMRPAPLPDWVGLSYWHVAYRLYAKFRKANGEIVEGLYFVRSDCDSRLIASVGNLVTDFNFNVALVAVSETTESIDCRIQSTDAPAHLILDRSAPPLLARDSAFASLAEAAAFLKYKPRSLSVTRGCVHVLAIAREEAAWKSRLIHVKKADWRFFAEKAVQPEICYEVAPIAYQWNRGVCVSS